MGITTRAEKGSALTRAEVDSYWRVVRSIAPPTVVENDGTTNDITSRGHWKSVVSARPSSLGDYDSILTYFDGDLSKCQIALEHWITGTDTLGEPTSAYLFTPETNPISIYLYNTSGYNHAVDGNDGRTAAVGIGIKGFQAGQGDLIPFQANVFINSIKADAEHFLASPAGSIIGGGVEAGVDGAFLQPQEFVLRDNGYDCAMAGPTVSGYRTNATGALDCFWFSFRSQSKGTQPFDVAYSMFGPHTMGIDFTGMTVGDKAIVMKADQRIYGNASAADWRMASSFPNDYISYDSASDDWLIVNGGNPVVQISDTTCTIAGSGGLLIGNTGALRLLGANQFTTGSSTATFTATNKPGSTTGAGPATWMRVEYGGSTGYVPIWLA